MKHPDHNRLIHGELTEEIISVAFEVLNLLKPGLDEKLYENAMVREFDLRTIGYDQQRSYPVDYKGARIGTLIPDLIVDQKVIVDTKVVSTFNENHVAQMLGYLAITDLRVGLLINFKHAKLQFKRIQK